MSERKQLPLRLDPAVHDALARWAADELRSVNAQIELLLRDALRRAGRLPRETAPMRPRGRPRRPESAESADSGERAAASAQLEPVEPGTAAVEPVEPGTAAVEPVEPGQAPGESAPV